MFCHKYWTLVPSSAKWDREDGYFLHFSKYPKKWIFVRITFKIRLVIINLKSFRKPQLACDFGWIIWKRRYNFFFLTPSMESHELMETILKLFKFIISSLILKVSSTNMNFLDIFENIRHTSLIKRIQKYDLFFPLLISLFYSEEKEE